MLSPGRHRPLPYPGLVLAEAPPMGEMRGVEGEGEPGVSITFLGSKYTPAPALAPPLVAAPAVYPVHPVPAALFQSTLW